MEYNGNPESVGYKVKYSRADGRGKTLSHVVRDRLEREHTIEDLEEWTEYRVQVQAFNAIGSGPWSQVVVGRTRESGTARGSQVRLAGASHPVTPPPAPACVCRLWPGHAALPPPPCLCALGLSRGTKAGAAVQHDLGWESCLCPAERPGLSPCLPAPDPTHRHSHCPQRPRRPHLQALSFNPDTSGA